MYYWQQSNTSVNLLQLWSQQPGTAVNPFQSLCQQPDTFVNPLQSLCQQPDTAVNPLQSWCQQPDTSANALQSWCQQLDTSLNLLHYSYDWNSSGFPSQVLVLSTPKVNTSAGEAAFLDVIGSEALRESNKPLHYIKGSDFLGGWMNYCGLSSRLVSQYYWLAA